MSLQVNLSGRDLLDAYQGVIKHQDIDWTVFTYEKGTNDLKVQGTGTGGLEELEQEFSDGKYVVTCCISLIDSIHSYMTVEFNMLLLECKIQMSISFLNNF